MTTFREWRAEGRKAVIAMLVLALACFVAGGLCIATALADQRPATPKIIHSPNDPTASTSATFTFTSSTNGVTFKCSRDNAPFTACSSGITYTGLAIGHHVFSVKAIKGSSQSKTGGFDWDILPGAPTILTHPANPTNSTSAAFTFTGTPSGSRYKCSLDGSNFKSCSPSGVTYTGLGNGGHTFEVKSKVGSNPASEAATFEWRIDTNGPRIAITFPEDGHRYRTARWSTGCAGGPGICGTARDRSGVTTVRVAVRKLSSHQYWNGSSFGSSGTFLHTAVGTTSWRLPMPVPPKGTYAVLVTATDSLGNVRPLERFLVFSIKSGGGTNASASTIATFSGTPQFTLVNSNFAPLVAKVTSSSGNPVAGVTVTFTAPASGASGSFASCAGGNPQTYSCVVTTDASGLATASTFAANGTPGDLTVTATASGVASPASFSLITTANFTIDGALSVSQPLYPGASQPLNLKFTNPNPSPFTITASPGSPAIDVSISSGSSSCPAAANFSSRGLITNVTIPANATAVSLSDLGINSADWPVISMIETHTNQNACRGLTLSLTFTGNAAG